MTTGSAATSEPSATASESPASDRTAPRKAFSSRPAVARSTYQGIEAGTADARIGTLIRISRALGMHVVDLLRDR